MVLDTDSITIVQFNLLGNSAFFNVSLSTYILNKMSSLYNFSDHKMNYKAAIGILSIALYDKKHKRISRHRI